MKIIAFPAIFTFSLRKGLSELHEQEGKKLRKV